MFNQRYQVLLAAVIGIWVFASPWLFVGVAATGLASGMIWNLWIVGALVAILSFAALVSYRPWQEWLAAALGAWLIASPWIFNFSGMTGLTISTVVAGIAVLVLSGVTAVSEPETA